MALQNPATPSGNAALHPENIPAELKAIPRWVLWRLEDRAGMTLTHPLPTGSDAGMAFCCLNFGQEKAPGIAKGYSVHTGGTIRPVPPVLPTCNLQHRYAHEHSA